MNKVLFSISFLMLGLISCQNNQNRQPSEAEIEQMVNERVEAKLAEKAKEQATNPTQDNVNVDETSDNVYTSTSSTSSSSSKSNRSKGMYEKGKSFGIIAPNEFEWYLKENEKHLKDNYRMDCETSEVTNRALYEEYKRGFIDGYKLKEAL